MIIVSKDKKIITNFDNVLAIQIDEHIKNTDGEKDYEIVAITEEKMANIGVYETEERAKEVLEEILQCAYNTEIIKNLNARFNAEILNELQSNSFAYQMPKE